MADSLHDELLAITGIAGAEIDGDAGLPSGVKVRLAPGADPGAVGRQVQAVLEHHGLRSRLGGGDAGGRSSPPPPPGAPGAVVRLPTPLPFPPPPPEAPFPEAPSPEARPREPAPAGEPGADAGASGPVAEPEGRSPFPVVSGGGGLAAVTVEEGRDGVVVTVVAGDGSAASRRARSGAADALDEAITAAVASLFDPDAAPPSLVSFEELTVDGTAVALAVLEVEHGARRVGATLADGGRALVVASAVWTALNA